jgi:thiol-disulfide isomerase/thioredoxin
MKDRPLDKHRNKWFSFSNIAAVAMAIFVIAMFFSPELKGVVIQGMMRIGFFQPDVAETPVAEGSQSDSNDAAFTDQNGKSVQLSDLKGKVVFLNFWASWCPPCIAEMPSIDQLYAKYKDDTNIVFLIVDVDGKIASSVEFMQKREFKLPVYVPAGATPVEYFSGTIPTTLIFNKTGNVVFKHTGAADYSSTDISDFIDKLRL